jgi:type IV pilus assembly protein PilP
MKVVFSIFLIASVVILQACGGSKEDALKEWISKEHANRQPKVKPLPEPTQFVPQAYNKSSELDPFNSQKLTQALQRESGKNVKDDTLITPELARRKGPLEGIPLDTISMVGIITKSTVPIALIKVDNLLYQVKVGDYLGKNYGRISKITNTQINLREIVAETEGEWVERNVTLQLQEKTQ